MTSLPTRLILETPVPPWHYRCMSGRWWLALAMTAGLFGAAEADDGAADKRDEPSGLPDLPHVDGPKLVDLGHGAKLDLPAGVALYERDAAQKLMTEWGNSPEGVVAVMFREGRSWWIAVDAADVGYVSDSDADELDPEGLMESYREGTAHQNIERKRRNIPELYLDSWSQAPRYDRALHRLEWGINAHDSNNDKNIDFETRLLGRNGFLSFMVIDAPERIESSRKETQPILDGLRFVDGSRYADHQDGDKDSGMGLRALVIGGTGLVVAKKTGLLVAFLAVMKKAIIFIGAAIAGVWRWLTGKKKKQEVELSAAAAAQPDEPGEPPASAG